MRPSSKLSIPKDNQNDKDKKVLPSDDELLRRAEDNKKILDEIVDADARLNHLMELLKRDDGSFTQDSMKNSKVLEEKALQEESQKRYLQAFSELMQCFANPSIKESYQPFVDYCDVLLEVIYLKIEYLKMRTTFSAINRDQTMVFFAHKLKQLMLDINALLTQQVEEKTENVNRESFVTSIEILQLCVDELFPKLRPMMVDEYASPKKLSENQRKMISVFDESMLLGTQAIAAILEHPTLEIIDTEKLKNIWRIEMLIEKQKLLFGTFDLPTDAIVEYFTDLPNDLPEGLSGKQLIECAKLALLLDKIILEIKLDKWSIHDDQSMAKFSETIDAIITQCEQAAKHVSTVIQSYDDLTKFF